MTEEVTQGCLLVAAEALTLPSFIVSHLSRSIPFPIDDTLESLIIYSERRSAHAPQPDQTQSLPSSVPNLTHPITPPSSQQFQWHSPTQPPSPAPTGTGPPLQAPSPQPLPRASPSVSRHVLQRLVLMYLDYYPLESLEPVDGFVEEERKRGRSSRRRRQQHHQYQKCDISTRAIVGIAVGMLVGLTVVAVAVRMVWVNR